MTHPSSLRGVADHPPVCHSGGPHPSRGRRPPRRPHLEVLEGRDTPSTFGVTNTLDDGPGSLRAAIRQADAAPGTDRIAFAIPTTDAGFRDANHDGEAGPGDYWSIAPTAALPAITGPLSLDGWSQGGPGYRGRPLIEVNGAGVGGAGDGLSLDDHFGSTVRGLVINRFGGSGIAIRGGGLHTLVGDFLGTDATGQLDRGNTGAGVSITDSLGNTIGGIRPGEGNLVSGNDLQGIHIGGPASVGNRIVGNLVGTTLSGDTDLGNGTERYLGDGVRIEGGRFNVIGGSRPAERNVVSGNFDDGVDLRDGASGNAVLGNTIGTDLTGTRPLGNGADGVFLQDASHNLVGSLISGDANLIGGNGYNGVFLYGDSHDNLIAGNFIGTNARLDRGLGNGTVASFADGIFLAQFGTPQGPSRNTILGNTLAYNRDGAISIDVATDANSSGNRLLRNSIFGNGGPAIDLGSDGVTPNDVGDGDTGPNRLQNFPVLRGPVEGAGGTVGATGTLQSLPLTPFRLEFFASTRDGDAEVFLGSLITVTGLGGDSPVFRFRYRPVLGKPYLTATATNLVTGDTSELSAAVLPSSRSAPVGAAVASRRSVDRIEAAPAARPPRPSILALSPRISRSALLKAARRAGRDGGAVSPRLSHEQA